jgi:hypothetical protein
LDFFFQRGALLGKTKSIPRDKPLPYLLELYYYSFEAHTLFSKHDSSRYSLYPRPKAWDAASIGAKISRLDFHKNFCKAAVLFYHHRIKIRGYKMGYPYGIFS